jgi:hypothetical protein
MSDTINYTYPQGVTPADVWATLQEAGRKIQEVAASQKETEKIIKETNASLRDTEKLVKEIGKRHGDFTNRFGEMVEYMVAPNLQDKFSEMGLDFEEVGNDIKIRNKKNNIFFQIDVYLQNNDMGMLVEVKADLTISDINNHIERLEKMRSYANLRADKRVFLVAVAGVVIKDDARAYALQQGLYLVEPSGQTFNITLPHNKPKEW